MKHGTILLETQISTFFVYCTLTNNQHTKENNIKTQQIDWNTDGEWLFFLSVENTCNNKVYVRVCPDEKYIKYDAKSS